MSEKQTYPVIRIPKKQESHQNFFPLVTIYGFTTFRKGCCVPELKALSRQPVVNETKQLLGPKRDMEQPFRLPICWSFRLDCEEIFGSQFISWKDLELLTQCNVLESQFITDTEYKEGL